MNEFERLEMFDCLETGGFCGHLVSWRFWRPGDFIKVSVLTEPFNSPEAQMCARCLMLPRDAQRVWKSTTLLLLPGIFRDHPVSLFARTHSNWHVGIRASHSQPA